MFFAEDLKKIVLRFFPLFLSFYHPLEKGVIVHLNNPELLYHVECLEQSLRDSRS